MTEKINIELTKAELQNLVASLSTQVRSTKKTRDELRTNEQVKDIAFYDNLMSGLDAYIRDSVGLINRLRPLYMDEWQIKKYPITEGDI